MHRWAWLGWLAFAACAQPLHDVRPAAPNLAPFSPGPADPTRKAALIALAPRLDAFFQRKLETTGMSGLAAGIVVDGELVYARGFGVRDRESQAPVDLDSVFRIGSLTKSFTALAVMQLRDEGKLALDEPMSSYLPELREAPRATLDSPPLTPRMLLTHAGGLAWDDQWGAVSFGFNRDELDELLQRGLAVVQPSGTHFEYSNLGYALLGRLVERVSGTDFREYVDTHILRPLGMSSSVWRASDVPAQRLVESYWGSAEPRPQAATPDDGVFAAAGGLYTSLRDYARYMAFQLGAYPPRDAPEAGPVRRSTLREMHEGQRMERSTSRPVVRRKDGGLELWAGSYGFGWFDWTTCGELHRIQHSGWEPNYFAHVALLPDERVGLVTLAASDNPWAMSELIALIRSAAAMPEKDRPRASQALYTARDALDSLLRGWDAELATSTFEPSSAHYPWYEALPAEFERIAREHGACKSEGELRPKDALRGEWTLRCERGSVDVEAALSPSSAPRIQLLGLSSQLPPDARMSEIASQVAAAVGGEHTSLAPRLSTALDPAAIARKLAHAAIDYGFCSDPLPIRGDGRKRAVFRLRCSQAPLQLTLELDPQTGRIERLELASPQPDGAICQP